MFIPTYLYIKKHKTTGLLYFGKTVQNPMKYKGSGVYWRNHLRKHGNDVSTIWYELFTDKDLLSDFADLFTEFNNIVKAVNVFGKKTWANELPENGLQGGQNAGMPSPLRGKKTGRPSVWKGKQRPEHSEMMKGRKQTAEHSQKISDSLTKYVRTKEHCDNLSKAKTGLKLNTPRICNTYVCPQCGKIGKGPNMKRYHFNNCKGKKHG
jgi:hypothetical protein